MMSSIDDEIPELSSSADLLKDFGALGFNECDLVARIESCENELGLCQDNAANLEYSTSFACIQKTENSSPNTCSDLDKSQNTDDLQDDSECLASACIQKNENSSPDACPNLKKSQNTDDLNKINQTVQFTDVDLTVNDSDHTLPASPGNDDLKLEDIKSFSGEELAEIEEGASVTCSEPGQDEMANETMPAEFSSSNFRISQLINMLKTSRSDRAALSNQLVKVTIERDALLAKLVEDNDDSTNEEEDEQVLLKLQFTIEQQRKQIDILTEKLATQDSNAKTTIAKMHCETKTKTDRLMKQLEDCRKEKETMVMKYVNAEQKNIEFQEKSKKCEVRVKEMERERDNALVRMNAFKNEKAKIMEIMENRAKEIASLKYDIEQHKDAMSSQEMKSKWHQNKLKIEQESHKETKLWLSELQQKQKESREECEKLRLQVQSYQESEVLKIVKKEIQLKETEQELLTQKQEQNDQMEVHAMIKQELECLKMKQKELVDELNTYKDQVQCLQEERLHQDDILAKYKETLQKQKKANRDLADEINALNSVQADTIVMQDQLREARQEAEAVKQANKDLESEMEKCTSRDVEHMKFSERLSDATVKLQSENLTLASQVVSLTTERDEHIARIGALVNELQTKTRLTDQLTMHLEEQTTLAQSRLKQLEENEDEIRTLKRRHQASTKDIMHQLNLVQKQLESYKTRANCETGSLLSRTSSAGSLNADSSTAETNMQQSSAPRSEDSAHCTALPDVDKQALINKIVRLQKSHIRQNEKIEFMQDHVNQLLAEVKKKSKIIQNYMMREECYDLRPPDVVSHGQTSSISGFITSLYNGNSPDDEEESRRCRKLQSVLEDTLLKNSSLKKNVETLGQEISRLSKQNREMQLRLDRLPREIPDDRFSQEILGSSAPGNPLIVG